MLRSIARLLLVAFVSEAGGVLVQAGRGWLDRKLNPAPPPSTSAPTAETRPANEMETH